MPEQTVKFEGCGPELPPVVPFVPEHNCSVVIEQSVVIDEKTLQPVVKLSERDLDKEIQSYKDECGISFVLRQIAAGRLSIDQIKDDGHSGHDLVGTPETINEAAMMSQEATALAQAEADKLGIRLTQADLQKFVQAEIAKAKAAEKQTTTNEGGDK